jgi:hypothetical protein
MNKSPILASILAFFLGTSKTLSEQDSAEHLENFEAEANNLAVQMEAKDKQIAELTAAVALNQSQVASLKSTHEAALQTLADKVTAAESRATTAEAALAVFGATEEDRANYQAEHTRLDNWYKQEKQGKNPTGSDATGAQLEDGNAKASISDKEAKKQAIREKYPRLFPTK